MKKYSYGKQYKILLETAQHLGEDVLAPKDKYMKQFYETEDRCTNYRKRRIN
jgi:hypothetical protein